MKARVSITQAGLIWVMAVAAWSSLGCNGGDSDFVGKWVATQDIPKGLRGADPSPSKFTTYLTLQDNHRFELQPVNWVGRWTGGGEKITLMPDKNYPSLALLNGYSISTTNGIPDINLTFASLDNSITWKFGNKNAKREAIIVFRKQKS